MEGNIDALNSFLLIQILEKQARLISDLNKRVKALEEKSAPTAKEEKNHPNEAQTMKDVAAGLQEVFGSSVKMVFVGEEKKDGELCDCFICKMRRSKEQARQEAEKQAEERKTQE